MGRQGTRAVNTPFGVEPSPMAAVSHKLASVQFKESMPWLLGLSTQFIIRRYA